MLCIILYGLLLLKGLCCVENERAEALPTFIFLLKSNVSPPRYVLIRGQIDMRQKIHHSRKSEHNP